MTDDHKSEGVESTTPLARETPSHGGASQMVLFAVVPLILVLAAAGGVWWYVGTSGAAAEQAAAKEILELGGFVHPQREGEHVNAVNLSIFTSDYEKPENINAAMQLVPAFTHVQNFNATNAVITDEHLKVVGQLDSLTQVLLDNDRGDSKVTDEGIAHLTGLENLHSLNIYGTQITDKGLESIGKIESLTVLNIGGTKVTGDLSGLLPLKNLQWLLVGNVELPDDAVETLAKLPKLTHLSMQGSGLSESALDRLRGMKGGIKID